MKIPNIEIATIYENSISYWFEQRMKETDRSPLKHALETGDCEAAENFINEQLFQTISYYDYAENFYHGFMAGLLVNIGGYRVKSNRESGNGRPDIVMTESKFRGRAMILELKISDTIQGKSDDFGAENFRYHSRDGKEVRGSVHTDERTELRSPA